MEQEKTQDAEVGSTKETSSVEQKEAQNMRQIVIETNGTVINVTKNETAGVIELIGIMQMIIDHAKKV